LNVKKTNENKELYTLFFSGIEKDRVYNAQQTLNFMRKHFKRDELKGEFL